jgi:hypothetical protein
MASLTASVSRLGPVLTISDRRIETGTAICAFSPAGLYWSENLITLSTAYVVADDLIFSACRFDESHLPEDFYTDFDDPRVEEVRLHSALLLAVDDDAGWMTPIPASERIQINQQPDLTVAGVVQELAGLLREYANVTRSARRIEPVSPPCAGGPRYELRQDKPSVDVHALLTAIDLRDHVLMRGLTALSRAVMMFASPFRAEAAYSLFVSLDASFSFVLRKLRESGYTSPTAYDAGQYIELALSDPLTAARYFEGYYEDRIKALHPESRFGVSPYLRFSVSEAYQLARALRAVWRSLILSQH